LAAMLTAPIRMPVAVCRPADAGRSEARRQQALTAAADAASACRMRVHMEHGRLTGRLQGRRSNAQVSHTDGACVAESVWSASGPAT